MPKSRDLLLLLTLCIVGAVACDRQPASDPATSATDAGDPETHRPVEAVSFLGVDLVRPQLPAEFEEEQTGLLHEAQAALEETPDDAESHIWLGRRTAYLGRYQDAIDIFSEAIGRHPEDARLFRHRGHRYITIRDLDNAVADLSRAADLTRGSEDEVEPDGLPNDRGIPTSTLQSNIHYHLGLAHYLDGDFESALDAYRDDLQVSNNPDSLVATSHWLYMTLRRLGRDDEAAEVLAPITREMEIIENHEYHQLLLMYRGEIEPDALWEDITADGDSLGSATVGYGIGNWYLYTGDPDRAVEIFEQIITGDQWAAFGYIAAEAELARSHRAEVESWRDERLAELVAPDGWLSLVELFWLEDGEHQLGTDPDADLVLPAIADERLFGTLVVEGHRVLFHPADGSGVELDGSQLDQPIELLPDGREDTVYLNADPYQFFLIIRSDRPFLRVRDLTRAAKMEPPEIEYFAVDPAWRIEARFEAYDPPRTIPVPTVLETENRSVSPGALLFEVDGHTQRLDAIESADRLFIIFGDETTGRETYGGGRYIYTDTADESGIVILDFNQVYNPPCVFTEHATCPLPPRQNRLRIPVEAGEKMVHGYIGQ